MQLCKGKITIPNSLKKMRAEGEAKGKAEGKAEEKITIAKNLMGSVASFLSSAKV